jgi:hypothetical protein
MIPQTNVNEIFARGRENARQPECCVGVEVVPRDLGGVTLKSWAEAVCRKGCHRVVEARGRRTVTRIGDANYEWQGYYR